MQYTIVDDDVEVAPIYRCDGRAKQPTRPHENHDPHMEWVCTWMDSWQKKPMQSLVVPACRSLESTSKIQGQTEMYILSVVRLRIGQDISTPAWIDRCTLNDNSHFTLLKNNSIWYLWRNMHMWHVPILQRTHAPLPNWIIKIHYNPFHNDTFNSYIYDDTIPTTASFDILCILVNTYIISWTLLIIGN